MSQDAKQSLTAVVVVVVFIGGGLLAAQLFGGRELPTWGKWVWLATGAAAACRLALAWRRRSRNR